MTTKKLSYDIHEPAMYFVAKYAGGPRSNEEKAKVCTFKDLTKHALKV